jgi:hypothetical protein
MLRETPRLFFLHFWGVEAPEKIADGLKAALAKVATKTHEMDYPQEHSRQPNGDRVATPISTPIFGA